MKMQQDLTVLSNICSQIFEGNGHYDTPEVRRFDELVAQYIRVFPERWSPAGIGMRMEVLGCDLPGKNTDAHMYFQNQSAYISYIVYIYPIVCVYSTCALECVWVHVCIVV